MAIAVFFFHLGSYGLWEPDEARYAEIAREMLTGGNFIVPHLNYVPYIEKPPLLYWTISFAFHFLGINEFAARLIPALSGFIGVVVTWWFARRVYDHRRALLAAAILITSPIYAAMGQVLTTDMLLTAFLTVAFFGLFLQWREGGRWWVAAYLAMALAALTKGPVGVVLSGLSTILFLWREGDLRGGLKRIRPLAGLILVATVALPWFIIVSVKLPGFLDFYIIGEHFRRALVANYSHDQPFYFYIPVLIVGLLPWSICLPLLLMDGTHGPVRSWCATTSGLVLILFSAAQAKLIPYILPALPPLAMLMADSILCTVEARTGRTPSPKKGAAFVTALGLVLCLGGIGCIVLWASAPYFHVRDIAILKPMILLCGIIVLAGGAVSVAAFMRKRAETGVAVVVITVAATLLTGTWGRIAVESLHSWAPLSRALASQAPDSTLIDYHRYPQAIPFYTRQRVVLATPFLSELRFGADHSPDRARYFLITDADLLRLWARDRSAVIIIDQTDLARLSPELSPYRIIASQGNKRAVGHIRNPG
jgi:4-amino-4-deoxy-L-arabinose transferase-like glycosyltransferase